MAQPSNLLYSDLIDHMVYNVQGGAQDPAQRDYRVAATNALRELVFAYNWQYYYTHGRIDTVAPYSTGTITSVGATVTLTGGTWPTWAKLGRLLVDNVVYTIASRTSGSIIVLDSAPNNTAFSGATFTIYQSSYPLPIDFKAMSTPVNELSAWLGDYITPQEWLIGERVSNYSGPARSWSLLSDPDQPGRFCLVTRPYPSEARTIDFIYQRSHRRMRLNGQETASRAGTVSASAAGTTVTGSGTSFSADMVGSFIRFGTTAAYPDGDGGLYPYGEQYRILTYTSATSIEVYPAITTAVSAVKYIVSDPVDVWQGMQTALLRRCELELAIARGRDMGVANQAYRDALVKAKESDAMVLDRRVMGESDSVVSLWAYPSGAI